MVKQERFLEIKRRAIEGEMVDCSLDWDSEILVWSHIKWGHRVFNLEIDGAVVKSTKTWLPIEKKLGQLLEES